MTKTFPPFFFRVETWKNSPVLKAMKAKAISGRKEVFSTTSAGSRFRQKGPAKMPPTIYAVTLGSLSSFVIRVIRKPIASIRAMEIMVTATGD